MIRTWLKDKIQKVYSDVDFDVLIPPNQEMGDYSINLAFVLGKKEKKNPNEVAEKLAIGFLADKEFKERFSKIEIAGNGFINFHLDNNFVREQLSKISKDKSFGYGHEMKGKKVVVEYTDPNPFKLFHIGHLMSNTIGETIARLYEAVGAKVIRVNYQGDVGLHVAKAVWGMKYNMKDLPKGEENISKKIEFLGNAYAAGAYYYNPVDKGSKRDEIEKINRQIYEKSDEEINRLYDVGRKWSLEYFETIYKKLGTKFDHYFFESETGKDGLKIVEENKKIFTESEGALIFKGEDHGLHNRVFINSQGLPTYEAKELGLNKKKFEKYSPDLSVIVTGNEINDYFKVLLKVMELTMPEVSKITKHIGHGMMRLSTGKMSSRTGDVITAESLIAQVVEKIKEKETENSSKKTDKEYESLAVSAIKYMVLKHNIGSDMIFDFEQALSIRGDAAPYLQYTYARLRSILKNSEEYKKGDVNLLVEPSELRIIRKLLDFPDVISESARAYALNGLALYLYELAGLANQFYEQVRVLQDDNAERKNARLLLVETTATVLKRGLNLLGIETLERI